MAINTEICIFVEKLKFNIMRKNTKTINLTLNEISLKKFKTIPTLKGMLWDNQLSNLKIGNNIITVNHYIYNKLLNFQNIGNFKIKEI